MTIWVDADACPKPLKEILFRAAVRDGIRVILVANQRLKVPASPHIGSIQVPAGFDVADREIARLAERGDLVISADIPLAATVVNKGCLVLEPRGEIYDTSNVQAALTSRNLMDEIRGAGTDTGGPRPFTRSDHERFSNSLARILSGKHSPGDEGWD